MSALLDLCIISQFFRGCNRFVVNFVRASLLGSLWTGREEKKNGAVIGLEGCCADSRPLGFSGPARSMRMCKSLKKLRAILSLPVSDTGSCGRPSWWSAYIGYRHSADFYVSYAFCSWILCSLPRGRALDKSFEKRTAGRLAGICFYSKTTFIFKCVLHFCPLVSSFQKIDRSFYSVFGVAPGLLVVPVVKFFAEPGDVFF